MKSLGIWGLVLAAAIAIFAVVAQASFGPDDLIPRAVIFGNPERTAPRISPDGSKIAFTAPVHGVMNIWISPANDLEQAKPVTLEKSRPIRFFHWALNGTHVLYLQDQRGDENFHLYAVDLAHGTTKDLTPYKKVRAEILAESYQRPNEILVGLNNRDERWHDAWIVNVATGQARLSLKNEGFTEIFADNTLAVRLAAKPTADGGQEYSQLEAGVWKAFTTIPGDDALTTNALSFAPDNKSVYMFDSRGRDKSALTLVSMQTKAAHILAESATSDVNYIITDPVTNKALAYASEYQRMEWHPLDPSLKSDLSFLDRQVKGYWSVISQSKDNNLWTLWIDNISEPVKFALYDRKKRALKMLFTARPSLEGAPLPEVHPRIVKARDGLDLVSYLTLPKDSDTDGDGVPQKPLPLVLMVHGGPWSRDSYSYSPYGAWFANRGYAVLTVNFRGSTGFGKAFVNAGDRQWAGKMHDDLLDAVGWAVVSGIAQKDKVAIYGASYGGYATLVGLAFTPDTFACGVDIVGPPNLSTFLANVPAYWASFRDTLIRRVGDPSTTEGKALLKDRSPLFRAAAVRRPLLIGQGANDPRVKQGEADLIARAMAKKGLPAIYVLYSDEGHGFARPENRLSFNAVTEAFLAKCLGGRAEPIGKDFEGSSIAVPLGEEHIQGLKEALVRP